LVSTQHVAVLPWMLHHVLHRDWSTYTS
jgi:hypothetical protein